MPDAVAAPNEAMVATVHAEGAQIYDCKADPGESSFGSSASQLRHCSSMARRSVDILLARAGAGRWQRGHWQIAGRAAGATPRIFPC